MSGARSKPSGVLAGPLAGVVPEGAPAQATVGAVHGVGELLSRLGRAIHCLQFSEGLNPAQWEALRFMARANRYSRTPSALACYLGTTKGTASQTLKALETKGLVVRQCCEQDRRVSRLELTKQGELLLKQDPIGKVESVCREAGVDCKFTVGTLARLLEEVQDGLELKEFGVCGDCTHFCGDKDNKAALKDGDFHCGLNGDPLSTSDARHICVEFKGRNSG